MHGAKGQSAEVPRAFGITPLPYAYLLLPAVCFGMVMPQLLRGSLYYHLRPPRESVAQQRRRHRAATAAANVAVADAAVAAATAAAKAAAAAEAAATAAGLPAPQPSASVPVLPPSTSSLPPAASPTAGTNGAARGGSGSTTLVFSAAEEVQRVLTRLQQARVAAEQQALAAAAAAAAAGVGKAAVARVPAAAPEGVVVVEAQGQTVVVQQGGKVDQEQEAAALGVAADQRTLCQGLLGWGTRASAAMWGAAVAVEARAREWAWVTFKVGSHMSIRVSLTLGQRTVLGLSTSHVCTNPRRRAAPSFLGAWTCRHACLGCPDLIWPHQCAPLHAGHVRARPAHRCGHDRALPLGRHEHVVGHGGLARIETHEAARGSTAYVVR